MYALRKEKDKIAYISIIKIVKKFKARIAFLQLLFKTFKLKVVALTKVF